MKKITWKIIATIKTDYISWRDNFLVYIILFSKLRILFASIKCIHDSINRETWVRTKKHFYTLPFIKNTFLFSLVFHEWLVSFLARRGKVWTLFDVIFSHSYIVWVHYSPSILNALWVYAPHRWFQELRCTLASLIETQTELNA